LYYGLKNTHNDLTLPESLIFTSFFLGLLLYFTLPEWEIRTFKFSVSSTSTPPEPAIWISLVAETNSNALTLPEPDNATFSIVSNGIVISFLEVLMFIPFFHYALA